MQLCGFCIDITVNTWCPPKIRKFVAVHLIVGNRKQLLLTKTLLKQNKNTNVQNAFREQIYMLVNFLVH